MIFESAGKASRVITSAKFRGILFKSLALTIALFIGLWFALEALVSSFLLPVLGPWPWLSTGILWLLGTGMVIGGGFLLAPATALFAGVFLDEIAEEVERHDYPDQPIGSPQPLFASLWTAVTFMIVVIGANLAALALLLIPGVNVVIFFLVNGYLLGREFFEFAALRYRTRTEVTALRRRHATLIFFAGLVIAGVMAVPVLNLTTPVFAAAMMVHLHKALTRAEQV